MTQFFHENFSNDRSLELPIVQKLISAYKLWQNYLPNFPQTVRYTLGSKIDSVFIETIENVFMAAHAPRLERERESKSVFLKNATKNLDLLKFLLQIAYQTKALDNKKYITLSEVLYEIGKMIGGWERSLNQNKLF